MSYLATLCILLSQNGNLYFSGCSWLLSFILVFRFVFCTCFCCVNRVFFICHESCLISYHTTSFFNKTLPKSVWKLSIVDFYKLFAGNVQSNKKHLLLGGYNPMYIMLHRWQFLENSKWGFWCKGIYLDYCTIYS